MLTSVPQSDCTTAREAASARLDGELSELEAARLDMHLHACAACRVYAEGIEAITTGLRAASLAQPQSRILLPRRSRLPLLTAAACAVLLAVAGGSLLGPDGVGNQDQPVPTATTPLHAGLTGSVPQKHLLAMLDRYELQPLQHPGGVQAI
jgi:predicted anti-sigma-YlaC factor YlaD